MRSAACWESPTEEGGQNEMNRRDKLNIRGNARAVLDIAEAIADLTLSTDVALERALADLRECSQFIIDVCSRDLDRKEKAR